MTSIATQASSGGRGLFFLILAVIATGCFALPYAQALTLVSPLVAVFGVFCWALLFSMPGAWRLRKGSRFHWRNARVMGAIAVIGVIGNYAVCQALSGSSATMFNVLARSEIIIAMILGWIFLRERVSLKVWGAVAVVLCGILVMRSESLSLDLNDWSTVLWALCSASSFASIQVLAKSIIHEVDPQALNVIRLTVALLLLLAIPGMASDVWALPPEAWGWLGLAAFFGPFIGRVAYTYALRYHSIARAMTAVTFAPVLTLVLEFVLFGRMLTLPELLGGALVLTGILLAFRQAQVAR